MPKVTLNKMLLKDLGDCCLVMFEMVEEAKGE